MIPKIFHFIWISRPGEENGVRKVEDLNQDHQDLIKKWRDMHPNFSFTLWTDENSTALLEKNTAWKNLFLREQNVGARSDILRYLILKVIGGIYIDMDCHCLKNIEPLLEKMELQNKKVGVPRDETGIANYSNFFIVGNPKAKFWGTLEDLLLKRSFSLYLYMPVGLSVIYKTGPLLITQVAELHKDEVLEVESQWCRKNCKEDKQAFVLHTGEGSWVPKHWTAIREIIENESFFPVVLGVILFVVVVVCWRRNLNISNFGQLKRERGRARRRLALQ